MRVGQSDGIPCLEGLTGPVRVHISTGVGIVERTRIARSGNGHISDELARDG